MTRRLPHYPAVVAELAERLRAGDVLTPQDLGSTAEAYGYGESALFALRGMVTTGRFSEVTGLDLVTVTTPARQLEYFYSTTAYEEQQEAMDQKIKDIQTQTRERDFERIGSMMKLRNR